MFNKVAVIINPASGVEYPVLFHLNQAFKEVEFEVLYFITQKVDDPYRMTHEALEAGVDVIAVYGGDGTVMGAAQALCQTSIPLMILPGGSANVMAKELKLPLTLPEALTHFTQSQVSITEIDMGTCNQQKFILRVSTGIWERIITNSDPAQKNRLGQLAYTMPLLEELGSLEQQRYRLSFENTTQELSGLGLMITNAGNTGIANISYLPDISITDGQLDAILLQAEGVPSLLSAVAATLTPNQTPEAITSWLATEYELDLLDSTAGLLDDKPMLASHLSISVLPKSLRVIV